MLLVIQTFLKSVVLKKSAQIVALVRDKLILNYAQIFSQKFCHINPLVLRTGYQKTFWEQMGASPWVLKILREGYSLPFVQQPPQVSFRNNKSALESSDFVTNEIYSLLEQGCIREVRRSEAHVTSPLSVVHNSSKPRWILDLSYLNQFISVPKSKYEDIRCVRDLFEKGDYFFKFDINLVTTI